MSTTNERGRLAASFSALLQLARTFAGSTYVRALAILSTGQAAAAVVPLLSAPILGRLYLPVEYGALALFVAISTILAAASTFQLHIGVVAERDEQRAKALFWSCIALVAAAAAASLPIGAIAYAWMGGSAYADVRLWMFALPASTLFAGVATAVTALANRRRSYVAMARIPLVAAIAATSLSILLGLAGWDADGLLLALLVGQAVSAAAFLLLARELVGLPRRLSWPRLLAPARRHRRYAIYTQVSELVTAINGSLPVYALSVLGAVPLLGHFNRARQLMTMPLALVGTAVGQVFLQRFSTLPRAGRRTLFLQTLAGLLVVGAPAMLILMPIAPWLFRLVLGPNWGEAGEVARILAPMLLLRLVASPLSTVLLVDDGQVIDFRLALASLALCAIGVAAPVLLGWPPIAVLYGFAGSYCAIYVAYLVVSWRRCSGGATG